MKDLFEHTDELPDEVKQIIDSWDNDSDEYKQCKDALDKMKPLGYTFEYYLDGVPFNLRKL